MERDKINETLTEFLHEMICYRMVHHTNEVCKAVGIDPDKIRYKRNSRYLVADRMNLTGLNDELKRIKWRLTK